MAYGTQTIPLGRGGKYGQLTVDTEKFSDVVHAHVYAYGLRQILNDAIADKTDDDGKALPTDQLVAKATKRLDTLYSGELRQRNAAEPVDPVEAEMYRIAKTAIVALMKNTTEYNAMPKAKGVDRVLAVINKRAQARGEGDIGYAGAIAVWLKAHPATRKSAERIVKERAASLVGDDMVAGL